MLVYISYERVENSVICLDILDVRFIPDSLSPASQHSSPGGSLVLVVLQYVVSIVLCTAECVLDEIGRLGLDYPAERNNAF
jgi:hypothetical protein